MLFSLQYSFEDEAISRFQPFIDPNTNKQVNSTINIDYSKVLSATLSLPLEVTDWWQMQNNFLAFWNQNKIKLEGEVLTPAQWSFRLNSVQTFELPKGLTLEVSGNYRSPSIRGFVKSRATWVLNAGLQKNLGGNKGKLSLNVDDIFWTLRSEVYTDDPTLGFKYRGSFRFSERAVRLNYSHSFGNSKVKGTRNRQTGSSEEQSRVN